MQFNLLTVVVCLAAGHAQAAVKGQAAKAGIFPFQTSIDGADSLSKVKSAIVSLDSGLANWSGNAVTSVPVALQTQNLLNQIDSTTTIFQRIGNRTEEADKKVMASAQDALGALSHIMETFTGSTKKFNNLPLGIPIMFGILKSLEVSTNKMIQVGLDGATPGFLKEMKAMQDEVKALFAKGFAAVE